MNDHAYRIPPSMMDADGRVLIDVGCGECGYNLRSLSIEGACPECKLNVAEALSRVLDEEGRIRNETPCLKCGYNLYMQPYNGKCPECGAAVSVTVRGDLLQFADPKWIGRLAAGVRWIMAGFMVTFSYASAEFILLFTEGDSLGYPSRPECMYWISTIFEVGMPLIMIGGMILLTSPEGRTKRRRENISARRACRFCLGTLVFVIMFLVVQSVFAQHAPPRLHELLSIFLFTLIFLLCPLFLIMHSVTLLRRAPNRQLPGCLAGLFAAMIFLGFVAVTISRSSSSGAEVLLMMILFSLIFLFVLNRIRILLRNAAEQALLNAAAQN